MRINMDIVEIELLVSSLSSSNSLHFELFVAMRQPFVGFAVFCSVSLKCLDYFTPYSKILAIFGSVLYIVLHEKENCLRIYAFIFRSPSFSEDKSCSYRVLGCRDWRQGANYQEYDYLDF